MENKKSMKGKLGLAGIVLAATLGLGCAKKEEAYQPPPPPPPAPKLLCSEVSDIPTAEYLVGPETGMKTAVPPQGHARNDMGKNTLTLYFGLNSWTLYRNDLQDLESFVSSHKNSAFWLVEGHCDTRGSPEFNYGLGEKRARGIADYLPGMGVKGSVSTVSYGKSRPAAKGSTGSDHMKNRRGVIIPGGQFITRGLSLFPADAYMIDSSRSMLDRSDDGKSTKWDQVKSFRFPDCADVYVFNKHEGLREAPDLGAVKPNYNTNMYDSLLELVQKPKAYESITVLTDGIDTRSKASLDAVIAAAKKKKIAVSVIMQGGNRVAARNMIRLATETGGGYYVQ